MNNKIHKHQVSPSGTSLAQLHTICQEWQSELTFWKDELQQLKQLILQYASLGNEDQVLEFKFIGGKVSSVLPNQLSSIQDRLQFHQNLLKIALQKDDLSLNENRLKEHQSIKQLLEDFRDDCMTTKTELQQLLDDLLVTERGHPLSDHSSF